MAQRVEPAQRRPSVYVSVLLPTVVPLLLACNKMDKSVRLDKQAVEEYARSIHARVFYTSAKTGENVDALFTELATSIISRKRSEMLSAASNYSSAAVTPAAQPEPVEEKKEENVIDIEPKEEITFDDFAKMQFQIGEIIKCEEVPKSKKLLCSQVRIGSQIKQIVSGIKQHYSAEEMVGKKVMVLVNLKPAKLAGVLSEGMLLCAEDAEGNLALLTPEKEMPAGAEIS